MRTYLGVDGGGSKTAFLLIDASGRVLGTHTAGSAYYLEIGFDALRAMLAEGIARTLTQAGIARDALSFAFLGLPAFGEDSRLLPALESVATPALPAERYRCGNDAVCGWAGGLAGLDGIHLICGTGSMAYGQFAGRAARAGGWGELFSDEGSAYWIARRGLNLFSRMSDGRTARGPLYEQVRAHFGLESDLDLCAAIYGDGSGARSSLAALAPLITQAALAGDTAARDLFAQAAGELLQMIVAVRTRLAVPAAMSMKVSYSGGLFQQPALLLQSLQGILAARAEPFELQAPSFPPVAGAAILAARLSGEPLKAEALRTLSANIPA